MARLLLRDLQADQLYYLQFRSVGSDGALSEWSRIFELQTDLDQTPPDVPTWVTAPNEVITIDDTFIATWNGIDLNLDQNKDFSHYEVHMTNGVTNVIVVTNNTSYTLTYAQNKAFFTNPAATVTFKIRSVDLTGNASAYTATKSATNAAPSAVSGLATTSLVDSVKVQWAANSDTDLIYYRVQVSTTSNSTGFSTVYEGLDTTYIHNTTAYATDHWYRVIAVDKFNSASTPTTSSAVRPKSSLTIDSLAPANPTWVSLTPSYDATNNQSLFTLSWNAVTTNSDASPIFDLDSYIVRYSVDNTSWEYISVPAGTTTAKVVVEPGKSYYFQIAAKDFYNNVSGYTNAPAAYPRPSSTDSTAPSTPSAVTASVSLGYGQVQISHPGTKAAGGTMEADVVAYQVFGGTSASPTTLLGTIEANATNKTAVGSFALPATGGTSTQTWYFRVKAVDASGNISASYSADATGAVGLIAGANIIDATITNAKINDLSASKITAGTISAQTVNIGATGVLNVDSTGVIKSNNWSAGTAGYRLTNTALEINNGSISAAALNIQDSANLLHAAYADFEWVPTFYNSSAITTQNTVASIDTTDFKFGGASLKLVCSNAGSNYTYFGSNIITSFPTLRVDPSTTYIVSFYAMIKTGATAATITPQLRGQKTASPFYDDSTGTSAQSVPANSTWNRYSVALTTTANVLGPATIWFALNAVTTIYIDGIQVERKIGAINTPSQWHPPGVTNINGGMITTGAIRSASTSDVVINGVTEPAWIIDTAGTAKISNLKVRGNVEVGTAASDGFDSYIKSYSYVADTTGWKVDSAGNAEFNSIKIGAGKLGGNALEDGTVSAEKLETNTILTADITVTGNLHATGVMGEDVGLSGDGFIAYGPDQVSISSWSQSGTTVTCTTAVNHGFVAGNKLVVIGIDSTRDVPLGTTINSTPAANQFTYTIASSATVSTTAVNAIAKSKSEIPSNNGPVLINFPTDGTNPNIISGSLYSDSVVISTSASVSGSLTFENNSINYLNAVQTAPKSAPVVTQTYFGLNLTGQSYTNGWGGDPTPTGRGLAKGHDGNYYVLTTSSSGSFAVIHKYGTNGAYISTPFALHVDAISLVGDSLDHYLTPMGLVYDAVNSKYHILFHDEAIQHNAGGGIPDKYQSVVYSYDTSFTPSPNVFVAKTSVSLYGPAEALGWDFVSNRLMFVWNSKPYYDSSTGSLTLHYLTMSGGVPTATGSGLTVGSGSTAGKVKNPAFVTRVNDLDNISQERVIIKDRRVSNEGSWSQNFLPYESTSGTPGTFQTNEQWPVAFNDLTHGAYYDSTTKRVVAITRDTLITYQSDDSYWSNNSSMTTTRYVAYSWYDSDTTDPDGGGPLSGATHETGISPYKSYSLTKRAALKVTTANIPYIQGNVETPNIARVYVANTSAVPSTTDYKLRADISAPNTSMSLTPMTSAALAAAKTPETTNGFLSLGASPASLVSTALDSTNSNNPFISLKGDGKWLLTGTNEADVSYTPGWHQVSDGASLSIGNGTLIGRKIRIGNWVWAYIIMVRGTTTNVGTSGVEYYWTTGDTFADFRNVHGTGRITVGGTVFPIFVHAINNVRVVATTSGGTRVGRDAPSGWTPASTATGELWCAFAYRI